MSNTVKAIVVVAALIGLWSVLSMLDSKNEKSGSKCDSAKTGGG